jgi:uncharacterized protein (TIGR03083 family)
MQITEKTEAMTDVNDIARIRGAEAWRLADTEYWRFVSVAAQVPDDAWDRPTECTGWTARELCLHVLGSMQAQASPRELIHQFRHGLPLNKQIDSRHWVDGLNELQIRERRELPAAEMVGRLTRAAAAAVRGRRRTPPPIRWLPIPFGSPVGWKPLTYLLRVGFTRDVWMHRIDLARATGVPLLVTDEHDGRIVADILAEWAGIHREPFALALTGPAGGNFTQGDGPAAGPMDAIEFCRTLSGRAAGSGVLAHPLPL